MYIGGEVAETGHAHLRTRAEGLLVMCCFQSCGGPPLRR